MIPCLMKEILLRILTVILNADNQINNIGNRIKKETLILHVFKAILNFTS